MERDRTTALIVFLRFLAGNPDGDSAARAMVQGAFTPLDLVAGEIYAASAPGLLELVGNCGFEAAEAGTYRSLPTSMPLPVCDAFNSLRPVDLSVSELLARYPLLAAEPALANGTSIAVTSGHILCAPVLYGGVAIGAITLLQRTPSRWVSHDWQYLEGITSAIGMWMNNDRDILVDHWRRMSTVPAREVRISERQRQILDLIAFDHTNGEIARELGYSVPTIKKDLQQMMRVLGTSDRRSTAGRAREFGLLPERRRGE
jgi:DNA-binding CsgD family transcriptional regulator